MTARTAVISATATTVVTGCPLRATSFATGAEVAKFTEEFKGFEEVKKIALVPEDFTVENGMLTPSMKLKRRVAVETYKAEIAALYA